MMKSLDDDSHVKTRLCQYEAYNGYKRPYIAKQIVLSKMRGQNILLGKYGLKLHDEEAIASMVDDLESSNTARARANVDICYSISTPEHA